MIIAIDFDGTLVEHCFPAIGQAVPEAFYWLQAFQGAGARLILHTMRSDNYLRDAVQFCLQQGIEFWGINENPDQTSWTNSPKPYAQVYIDDAAFGCPLRDSFGSDRPMVDWRIVGPRVLEMCIRGTR